MKIAKQRNLKPFVFSSGEHWTALPRWTLGARKLSCYEMMVETERLMNAMPQPPGWRAVFHLRGHR